MSDHAHGLGELFQAEDADRVVEQAELDAGRARGMRSTDGVQLPVSVGAALNPGRMSRSGSRPATAPPKRITRAVVGVEIAMTCLGALITAGVDPAGGQPAGFIALILHSATE